MTFDKSLLTPANELEDSDDKLLKPEEVIYEAESPDEAALVYTAKGQGSTDRQVGDFQNFVCPVPVQDLLIFLGPRPVRSKFRNFLLVLIRS